MEPDKEATVPGYAELKTAENWVHLNAVILNSGRTKHIVPQGTQNVEEELDKLTQAEPYIPRLRAINEDEKFTGYETAWQIRTYGDDQQYAKPPPKSDTNTTYATIAVRSFKWPGSATVYQNGKWESIYIGDGIALGGDSFMPIAPAEIMQDPEDGIEQDEPNPKTAVEPIEPDTDEEKKEEEKKEDQ